jgi:hypothetical protein
VNRPVRTAAAAVAALSLAVLVSPAAHAGAQHLDDPVDDVESLQHSTTPAPCGTDTVSTGVDDPRRDLTGVTVTHHRLDIEVELSLREVRAFGHTNYVVSFRTAEDTFLAELYRGRKHPDLVLFRHPRAAHGTNPNGCPNTTVTGRPVECGATDHSVDHRHDTVTLGFATACLGDPRWVEVGAAVFAAVADDGHGNTTRHYDQWGGPAAPHAPGQVPADVFGPRIRLGRG